jgi:urease accessory protein
VLLLRAAPFLAGAGATAFFAIAGLAHGYAYGESIAGAEPTPLIAYLAGFVIVQIAIGAAGYALARAVDRRHTPRTAARAFGGALSIAGSAFLVLAFAA